MYQKAIMDIVTFDVEDIITTSDGANGAGVVTDGSSTDIQPPIDTTPPAPAGDNVDNGTIV